MTQTLPAPTAPAEAEPTYNPTGEYRVVYTSLIRSQLDRDTQSASLASDPHTYAEAMALFDRLRRWAPRLFRPVDAASRLRVMSDHEYHKLPSAGAL